MNILQHCQLKLMVISFLIWILLKFLDSVLQPVDFIVIKAVCSWPCKSEQHASNN